MGQVPHKMSFLIVGSGRLASHLSSYFKFLGLEFEQWSRKQDFSDFALKMNRSSHILLAISDSAIVPFYETAVTKTEPDFLKLENVNIRKTFLHMSGRVNDARIPSAHPLMAFSERALSFDTYKKIHFVICGVSKLEDVLPGLPNSFSLITPEQKNFYHALCVFSGNFSILLWQSAWAQLNSMNIPFAGFETYLNENLKNFCADPKSSLTGPLIRKDIQTLKNNFQALPDSMAKLYKEFVQLYSPELFFEMQKLTQEERLE